MSTMMYSMQIPAAKRQRISRLNKKELLYPVQSSYNTSSSSPTAHKLPKSALVGIIKYLDPKSLQTFSKTSTTMHQTAKKYKKYQQKLNKENKIHRIVTKKEEIIDSDIDMENNNKIDSLLNAPTLSSLSLPLECSDDLPSLSLEIVENNNYSDNSMDHTKHHILHKTSDRMDVMMVNNTKTKTNIYNHLTINSHLNLHLKYDNINNDDGDIDIFEKDRCSLLDILNNMEQFTL